MKLYLIFIIVTVISGVTSIYIPGRFKDIKAGEWLCGWLLGWLVGFIVMAIAVLGDLLK